jgi:sugar (pentulose or hexulose) kinase
VSSDILAIDVGTSALKIGVFGPQLDRRAEAQRAYAPHIYNRVKADIYPRLGGGRPASAAPRCQPT